MDKKTNLYQELKDKQSKEYDNFFKNSKGMFYAFGQEQFKKGMEKIGLTENDVDKIYGTGFGLYYKKEVSNELKIFLEEQTKEMKKAVEESEQFIYDMFYYELANHEYGYTYDLTDTLEELGYTMEEIKKDKRLLEGLSKAKKRFF